MDVHGTTRVLGLFGDPVAHSFSPGMHARFAQQTGEDTVYVPFHVSASDLEQALRALPSLGVVGVNITIPHKEGVYRLVDRLAPAAQAIGAVNTVMVEGRTLTGDNTDADGFLADIQAHFPARTWEVCPALVLGAGGAARAVVYALQKAGCPEIQVANRTVEKAEALLRELSLDPGWARPLNPEGLASEAGRVGLVVNTTSQGLHGERIPGLAPEQLTPGTAVYDLIYNPSRTPLLQEAEARGLPVANGLGMLVRQGAISYARWTGAEPQVEPVIQWLAEQVGE